MLPELRSGKISTFARPATLLSDKDNLRCAISDPTVDQLTDIAVSTARLARHMLGTRSRVAMLSFSTKGSAAHPSVGKMQAATAQARRKADLLNIEADFDGELQVDAALVPEIARRKLSLADSKVAGRAISGTSAASTCSSPSKSASMFSK